MRVRHEPIDEVMINFPVEVGVRYSLVAPQALDAPVGNCMITSTPCSGLFHTTLIGSSTFEPAYTVVRVPPRYSCHTFFM